MTLFLITARTATARLTFNALARSSSHAALMTAELFGDEPCGITVILLPGVLHG